MLASCVALAWDAITSGDRAEATGRGAAMARSHRGPVGRGPGPVEEIAGGLKDPAIPCSCDAHVRLFKEAFPRVSSVAVLWHDLSNPSTASLLSELRGFTFDS